MQRASSLDSDFWFRDSAMNIFGGIPRWIEISELDGLSKDWSRDALVPPLAGEPSPSAQIIRRQPQCFPTRPEVAFHLYCSGGRAACASCIAADTAASTRLSLLLKAIPSYFAICQTLMNSAKLGSRSPAACSNINATRFFVRAHITPNKIPLTASTTIE